MVQSPARSGLSRSAVVPLAEVEAIPDALERARVADALMWGNRDDRSALLAVRDRAVREAAVDLPLPEVAARMGYAVTHVEALLR